MNCFKRAWRGKVRLWKIFWLVAVVVPIVSFNLLIGGPLRFYHVQLVRYSYYAAAWMLFNCWSLVPVWRCAANTNWWVWTRLARMSVVILAVQILYYAFTNDLTDLSYEKRATADCRRLFIKYARTLKIPLDEYLHANAEREIQCRHSVAGALR